MAGTKTLLTSVIGHNFCQMCKVICDVRFFVVIIFLLRVPILVLNINYFFMLNFCSIWNLSKRCFVMRVYYYVFALILFLPRLENITSYVREDCVSRHDGGLIEGIPKPRNAIALWLLEVLQGGLQSGYHDAERRQDRIISYKSCFVQSCCMRILWFFLPSHFTL